MLKITGLVCRCSLVGFNPPIEVLFGKGEDGTGVAAFGWNGFRVFSRRAEARRAAIELSRRTDLENVCIAKVVLRMGETNDECESFRTTRGHLIAIGLYTFSDSTSVIWELVGEFVDGRAGMHPSPGARLFDNGFKTIDCGSAAESAYDRACHIALEMRRQDKISVRIGTFRIFPVPN